MYFLFKISMIAATIIGGNAGAYQDNVVQTCPSTIQAMKQDDYNESVSTNQKDSLIVLLDSYFNNEKRKTKAGALISIHYKWNQKDYGGYSKWGEAFRQKGAATRTTFDPPSKKNLNNASIYIITDPDITKENSHAKYMTPEFAKTIARWVSNGGVLVLMANDSGNADIKHFNLLTQKFGFRFNEDSYNHVPGNNFDLGAVNIAAGNPIFKQTRHVYIKELSTITTFGQGQVRPILEKQGRIIAVSTHYGKGVVFAVGDPWFYNEYVNGRLPDSFENVKAMKELTNWLVSIAGK